MELQLFNEMVSEYPLPTNLRYCSFVWSSVSSSVSIAFERGLLWLTLLTNTREFQPRELNSLHSCSSIQIHFQSMKSLLPVSKYLGGEILK
jgi:hypothetical protein